MNGEMDLMENREMRRSSMTEAMYTFSVHFPRNKNKAIYSWNFSVERRLDDE